MAENKIQFQKGLSLSVFLRRFGAEEQTPVTPVCPWQAKRNSTAGSGHLPSSHQQSHHAEIEHRSVSGCGGVTAGKCCWDLPTLGQLSLTGRRES
jgi:hypothetical protein